MNFVALDIGASSTRFTSNSGKFATLPNNVIFVEKNSGDKSGKVIDTEPVNVRVASDDLEDSLEVIIQHDYVGEVGGGKYHNNIMKFFPMHAVVGSLAESTGNCEYPSMAFHKSLQRINYLSIILATAITKHRQDLNNDIALYVALPPSEVKDANQLVNEILVGNYDVYFPKVGDGLHVEFTIKEVTCLEESVMAMTSFFFNLDGSKRAENRDCVRDTILSLDIGASTTDVAIIKNGAYLDKSGRTFRSGGNNVRDLIIDYVEREKGFTLPVDEANAAMVTGLMKSGSRNINIGEVLDKAKEEIAVNLVHQMELHYANIKIPLQMVDLIIVSGGGSIKAQYINADSEPVVTSQSMSSFITSEMERVSPDTLVREHTDTPRLANIHGLFIRALHLETRRVK